MDDLGIIEQRVLPLTAQHMSMRTTNPEGRLFWQKYCYPTEELVTPLGQLAARSLPLRKCGVCVIRQFDRPGKLDCYFVPRWSFAGGLRFFHEGDGEVLVCATKCRN